MKESVMGGACDTHGEGKNAYRINKETEHLEGPFVNGRVMIKQMLIKQYGREWIGFNWLG
jgi:hypothetical protein